MKLIFYDKNWERDLDGEMGKAMEYHDLCWQMGHEGNCEECAGIKNKLMKFIERQKEFSYLAGHADGLKEGLYERQKMDNAHKELKGLRKNK